MFYLLLSYLCIDCRDKLYRWEELPKPAYAGIVIRREPYECYISTAANSGAWIRAPYLKEMFPKECK